MSWAVDSSGYPILLSDQEFTIDAPHDGSIVDPLSIDSLEVARRRDAVRDAAREFEDLSDQDVRERLKGLTTRDLSASEIAIFRQDVREQVLDDLVDALDHNRMGRLRARRRVRVVAPRGYIVKAVRGLSEDELATVENRLKARGWANADVHSGLMDKRPDK